MILTSLDDKISALEVELAAEQLAIVAAIAEHQIGPGYWQRRHEIARRLRIALALRDALSEVSE
ncbi:MAG: hypothetical protein WBA36_03705 [Mesorhizobium sp.]